jgi:hypothetical protein
MHAHAVLACAAYHMYLLVPTAAVSFGLSIPHVYQ